MTHAERVHLHHRRFQLTPLAVALLGAMTALSVQASESTELPVVTVSNRGLRIHVCPQRAPGGQVAKGARLGLLGNQDVMDTPFNITSYTAELIENQQARTVNDVLANDPSVRFTTSASHAVENARIRGFDQHSSDLAFNGLYGMAPQHSSTLEFVERVEVLKGPSAMFAGMAPSGGIGGVINLIPKRAADEPLTRVTAAYQTQSQLGLSADVGRRFGADNVFGVRINGSISDGETDIEGQDKKRDFVSAALDYSGESLTASLDVYSGSLSWENGVPAMFGFATTIIPSAPDPSTNFLSTADGEVENQAVIARVEYVITDNVSAFASYGIRQNDFSGWMNGTHIHNVQPNGNAQVRGVAQLGYDDTAASELGSRIKFDTAGIKHELVVQVSRLEIETGSLTNTTGMVATNIHNPIAPPLPALPTGPVPKGAENILSSVALVDTLLMMDDKLRVTLGLRQQAVETKNFNALGVVTSHYDEKALTPAVGVVVKPWGDDISLYANYVEGLSKGDSVTVAGGYVADKTFEPYQTVQKELGVKWAAGTFTNTVSVFEINKPTLISTGTAPNMVASDDGEVKVSGLEWNTFGEIIPTVRVLGGVSYTKGELVKTQGGTNQGNEIFGVPNWQANLGAEWDTPLSGLSVNGRVIATDEQYLNNANTASIPGWSQFDLGARYTTQVAEHKTVFRLNVNNVLDRHYWSGAFAEPRATLAQGRTMLASVTVDF
jgi:iron complex outermembrane receptor protein